MEIGAGERAARWLRGDHVRQQLADRAADAALTSDLDLLVGQTLDDALKV